MINYKKKYKEYKKEKKIFEKKYEHEIKKEKDEEESRLRLYKSLQEIRRGPQKLGFYYYYYFWICFWSYSNTINRQMAGTIRTFLARKYL